ncbi:serine carboxypeptidase, putative [Ixodes scapularis]|uniref:Serine carboxypeptidase, putative n=1 Tax=Ixodes scapularis TaxID=6945 RepID=B7QF79_IXOSC|nr:serine carboxypeptidase, putative [Ixodes scapularis]|eukprot:XP_002414193.1 serine carboxypeptidase, putative [Ixodes scapularis]
MNMIFLDQPVGSGYSYTKSQNGYAKNLDDVATSITEFLRQFLKMFPEFNGRDFYVGGESYGARFAVGIAHSLFTENNPEIPLNVKGLICGAGFLGPLLEVADSHEFLFEVSMLTSEGRDEFASRFELIRTLAATNQTAALLLLLQTVFTSDTNPTLFQQLTGYDNQASALYATKPANMLAYEKYVQTKEFKKAVHIGDSVVFEQDMFAVMFGLLNDYLANIDAEIEDLLDTYKVLFYYGQMDSLFPAVHQKAFARSLNWTGSDVFRNANRQTWRAGNSAVKLLGYKTTAAQFTEIVLLKAGHYAAVDEPRATYYMMSDFFNAQAP